MRMRANAIQRSPWELMTDDDFDHLEIVRCLAHSSSDISTGSDDIFGIATMIMEAYGKGHNLSKFEGKMLPDEVS